MDDLLRLLEYLVNMNFCYSLAILGEFKIKNTGIYIGEFLVDTIIVVVQPSTIHDGNKMSDEDGSMQPRMTDSS